MFDRDLLLKTSLNFINETNKKILLIIGDIPHDIYRQFICFLYSKQIAILNIDLTNPNDISKLLKGNNNEGIQLIIIKKLDENILSGNLYHRYYLERWNTKIIVLCGQPLLHPILDPSIYFAPIFNNRIQKHLLLQLKLSNQSVKFINSNYNLTEVSVKGNNLSSAFEQSLYDHFLNKLLMTNDAIMMQMLADRVQQDKAFKEMLFKLLHASRNDERIKIGAANAITVLNYARISFDSLDFSETNITGANLQSGIFHNTKFNGANLTNVNFKNSFIVGTDFSDAILDNVYFGELSVIDLGDDVIDCCINGNGSLLAAALWCYIIIIVSIKSKQILKFLPGHIDVIETLHFHPTKNILASAGGDKSLRIWDIDRGAELIVIKDHLDKVNQIKFSPNGAYLVSVSADVTIRIRETNYYKCIKVLEGHIHNIEAIDIDSTSRFLVSSDDKQKIKLWDLISGRCIHTYEHKQMQTISHYSLCVRFSPDGKFIASGNSGNQIDIWDINAKECRYILTGHTDGVRDIDFSPDGQYLVSCSDDRSVRIWSTQTGECEQILQGHASFVGSVNYTPDQQTIISGSRDKKIRFWSTQLKHPERHLDTHVRNISSLALSSNGKYLATSGEDCSIRLWNIGFGTCHLILKGHKEGFIDIDEETSVYHNGTVTCLEFTLDNDYLISGSEDRSIRFWNIKNGNCIYIINEHNDTVTSISISPDGLHFLSGSHDKTAKMWNIKTGKLINTFLGHTEYIHSVCFSPDGLLCASSSGSTQVHRKAGNVICVWDLSSFKCIAVLSGHTEPVWHIAFTPDQKSIVSLSSDDSLRIWPLVPSSLIGTVKVIQDIRHKYGNPTLGKYITGHPRKENSDIPPNEWIEERWHILKFSPDGKFLIYGEGILPLRILSMDTLEIITTIQLDHTSLYIFQFIPAIKFITVNNRDYSIRAWEPRESSFPHIKWRLIWAYNLSLEASHCRINNAQMSDENACLLIQHGAKGNVKTLSSNNIEKLEALNSTLPLPLDSSENNVSTESLLNDILILEERITHLENNKSNEAYLEQMKAWNDLTKAHLDKMHWEQAMVSCLKTKMITEQYMASNITQNMTHLNSNFILQEEQEKAYQKHLLVDELAQYQEYLSYLLNKLGDNPSALVGYALSVDTRRNIIRQITDDIAYKNKDFYELRLQIKLKLAKTLMEIGSLNMTNKEMFKSLQYFHEAYNIYNSHYVVYRTGLHTNHNIQKIISILVSIGNALFFKGDIKGAKDCYEIMNIQLGNPGQHVSLFMKYYEESNYNAAIEQAEIVIQSNPDASIFNINLACLYHIKGITENNNTILDKSEKYFLKVLDDEEASSIQAKVEYSIFLIQQNRHREAFIQLSCVVTSHASSNVLQYKTIESVRLPKELRDELLESKGIEINNKALAYYLLGIVFSSFPNMIIPFMDKFSVLVGQINKPIAYSLIGYTFYRLNDFHTAKRYFEIAFHQKKYYPKAMKNIILCQQQIDRSLHKISEFDQSHVSIIERSQQDKITDNYDSVTTRDSNSSIIPINPHAFFQLSESTTTEILGLPEVAGANFSRSKITKNHRK